MPRYVFKDLYVPSFDTSGSADSAADDLPPTPPNLTINYTRIDFDKQHDEFAFKALNGDHESAEDRWIDIIAWDHGRETTPSTSDATGVSWETETGALNLPPWELDTVL